MITLKVNGYKQEDYKFLLTVLKKGMDLFYHERCLTVDCEDCIYHRACNDICSLMVYLIKRTS